MSYSDTPSLRQAAFECEVFRRGRLGMGWSPSALAETVLVPEQTVLEWEEGSRPIPPQVLSWVAMYSRNPPDTDETSEDFEEQQTGAIRGDA